MIEMIAEVKSVEAEQATLDATLMLADGTCFRGRGLGPVGLISGEMVFTTAMTGYQETLTDPSYRGQLLMFTYPLIGNYGTGQRAQSPAIQPSGVVLSTLAQTWTGRTPLAAYLERHAVPTISEIDTRAVARWIRREGAGPAALAVHAVGQNPSPAALQAAVSACAYDHTDYLADVTIAQPAVYGSGPRTVALLDCGNKRSVIEEFTARGLRVITLPADTGAADILALHPDGVVISNGPGNPAVAGGMVTTLRALWGRLPLFGICLGHQLLALAAGATTFKLPFGHRGANHPVQDCETGQAFVTTQNHGYAVEEASLPSDLLVSHRNVNDGTVEGLRHRELPIRSVQFHPEGAPGPREAGVTFDTWLGALA